jgi:hypothetical protein
MRDAAEDPFAQSAVAIPAGHNQICAFIPSQAKEFGGDRPSRLPPYLARDDSMAAKVSRDIGKISSGAGFWFAFADSDNLNPFGPLQKRKRITHRAAAFARVLPGHDDPTQPRRCDGFGHNQDRPARAQQDHARIDEIIGPGTPCADNDEIRCSSLPQDKFVRQLKCSAPFHLLKVLAFVAESSADIIETRADHTAVMFRGLVIDDEASGGERGPWRQTPNSYEGRLKLVRQRECNLNPRFAIASGIDVDHHGCERGRLFRFASIGSRAD